ncbi:branched-chain amino acid ABC transporter permease [Amycolatopsis jejuensis]|uniref:branched-chain amino acid ABC transporter permease n=1 Tax=Amycolatopsis jejuensis TaxID=330084 RepID=UPI000527CBD4|nr:branched-chain amino acid ABC transporter permease [Amycolatopsis jejuensis]
MSSMTRIAAQGKRIQPILNPVVVAAAAAVFLAAVSGAADSTLMTVALACVYAIAALGLTVVFGLGGMLSLAQAAIMAVGGYTVALLAGDAIGPLPALLLSIVAGAAVSGLSGIIGARTKSHYFALATLALAECVQLVLVNESTVTGGSNGHPVAAGSILGLELSDPRQFVLLAVPLVAASGYLVHCLRKSRFGLALKAAARDEYMAKATGVAINRGRVLATVVSGALAGLAGALLALLNGYVGPQDFDLGAAVLLLLIVVFGGASSSIGTVIAAVVLTYVSLGMLGLAEASGLVYGLATLLLLVLLPGGVAGVGKTAYRAIRARRKES